MERHPLIMAYHQYVESTIDYRVAVLGQVDAGKSALVNRLADADSHISAQTDATRTVTEHPYGARGRILDFPGVGTTEYSPKQYRKLIAKTDIKHVLYVFSSKIRDADEATIRYLAKKGIHITFVYNKSDTLVDVSGKRSQEILMNDKDTELHVTFKKQIDQPLHYYFTSVKEGAGIAELRAQLDRIFEKKDARFEERVQSAQFIEKFLTKKMNGLATRLLSPGFKDIILSRAYRSIEEMTESHYQVTAQDGVEIGQEIPRAATYINRVKNTDKDMKNPRDYINHLASVFSAIFKMRKLNVVTFIASSLGEIGIKNIYPVMKGTFEYVGDMNDFAREVIKHHR
ncbi:GTPase domain-containing protein [Salinicoccus sp. ID82-1]|uniref:GTPase domain-containing protein n=2 Tax=Staphylococcaceae TaxID=90964 RepID=A0A558AVM6_9STAP|nr:GTPase domain-containing protein [Salinicoccus sp. ID82-1]TVT28310.1 GTPase domain-containing protein [Salinicoccus cyprini]